MRHTCVAHSGQAAGLLETAAGHADLRGVPIDRRLLTALLAHSPTENGRRLLTDARFEHAVFTEGADFSDVRFGGEASFDHARFVAEASFSNTLFDTSSFDGATFVRAATFTDVAFNTVSFRDASFRGTADFRITVGSAADFYRALFEDSARITCQLEGELSFSNARFRGLTVLRISGDDSEAIMFDDVLCEGQLDASLAASRMSIDRSRLERGGQVLVGAGQLTVTGRLGRPMLIAATEDAPSAPQLVSVRGADLAGTTLSGLDMQETRFARATGLDELRIDGSALLRPPHGPLRTRRFHIADEDDAREGMTTSYADVAAIYRDLRAGQEGRKDEPGSADFYYGEMEMRRLAAPRTSTERAILEGYRVVAGYGLRASRSLATLGALVVAATIAFHGGLVEDPPPWLATLLFSLRSTVSVVREPQIEGMTLAGQYVQLGLRFAGPVLLALAILAIRARVRR